jgi:hypothetical protein
MANRLTDAQLAELARLEKEATPGTWSTNERTNLDYKCAEVWGDKGYGSLLYTDDGGAGLCDVEDAVLITAARNALPALLEEVREAREIKKLLREQIGPWELYDGTKVLYVEGDKYKELRRLAGEDGKQDV